MWWAKMPKWPNAKIGYCHQAKVAGGKFFFNIINLQWWTHQDWLLMDRPSVKTGQQIYTGRYRFLPFLFRFAVGGLGFKFLMFVVGWRHAFRSKWPFTINLFLAGNNKSKSCGKHIYNTAHQFMIPCSVRLQLKIVIMVLLITRLQTQEPNRPRN